MAKSISEFGMKILLQVIQLDSVLLSFPSYASMGAQIDITIFTGKVKRLEKLDLFHNLLMKKEKRTSCTLKM
jgi:hypothetical protein